MPVTSPTLPATRNWRSALRRAAALFGFSACAAVGAGEPAASFTEFSFQDPSHGSRGAAFRATVQPRSRLVLDLGLDAREHIGGGVGMASVGAGYRMQLAESTRVVVSGSINALVGDYGPDDEPGGMSGVEAGVGMDIDASHRFTERLEMVAHLKLAALEKSPLVAGIGARIYVAKRLAVAADWLHDDLSNRYGIGLRLDFSRRH
jgi:hypothetical protein